MSIQQGGGGGEDAAERSGFFIGADSDNVSEEDGEDHRQLILQRANALASENRLREAIDWFSVAMRYGPVIPEHLSTFVDCVVRNFSSKLDRCCRSTAAATDDMFDCPNCRDFLGEPVTIACGHSYCKRCLQRRLLSKCKLCGEPVTGQERQVDVILCGLLEKWFPGELRKSKTLLEVDELCRGKRYQEAVSLATDVIRAGECCQGNSFYHIFKHNLLFIGISKLRSTDQRFYYIVVSPCVVASHWLCCTSTLTKSQPEHAQSVQVA